MMTAIVTDLLPASTAAAAIVGIISILLNWRKAIIRRTAELAAAETMLAKHYEAVDQIVDDPALPEGALEFLCRLLDGLQDESFVETFVRDLMVDPLPSGRSRAHLVGGTGRAS